MSTAYYYVQYETPSGSFPNANVYTINPWTNADPSATIFDYNGTSGTSGSWNYFVVDQPSEENLSVTGYYTTTQPASGTSYATISTNSSLFVYVLGIGGNYDGSSSSGGGGTGGLGGAYLNITYNPSAGLYPSYPSQPAFGGVDYTQTNYVPPPVPPDPSYNPPPTINVYAGNGSNATSSAGGDGSTTVTSTYTTDNPPTTGSYILYGNDTVTDVVPNNIGFVIGGVGGKGSPAGSSYTALPSKHPKWVSSYTDTSSGNYYVTLADGTNFEMPSSPVGQSAQPSSLLFAIFTPTSS